MKWWVALVATPFLVIGIAGAWIIKTMPNHALAPAIAPPATSPTPPVVQVTAIRSVDTPKAPPKNQAVNSPEKITVSEVVDRFDGNLTFSTAPTPVTITRGDNDVTISMELTSVFPNAHIPMTWESQETQFSILLDAHSSGSATFGTATEQGVWFLVNGERHQYYMRLLRQTRIEGAGYDDWLTIRMTGRELHELAIAKTIEAKIYTTEIAFSPTQINSMADFLKAVEDIGGTAVWDMHIQK